METKTKKKEFDLSEKWKEVEVAQGYYPTRLEYFAGKALQGLVVSRAPKDYSKIATLAVALAKDLEDAVDSTQD